MSLHCFFKNGQEDLLAQVKGLLKNSQAIQLVLSGDLRHSLASLAILPPFLGLDAELGRHDVFIEGRNYYIMTRKNILLILTS